MRAYDLAILPVPAERDRPDCHGWCFGLPPGIVPQQWPLDPANGYPLQHAFTLLLPEDYRCHGPDLVAVALFASAIDHNDGGPLVEAPEIADAMAGEQAPDDPGLLPFWQAERAAHPRLHRMRDLLGIAHAAILLTRAEFDGALCCPPALAPNPHRARLPPPEWMARGSAAAYWAFQGDMRFVRDALGTEPAADLAESRALRWTPRADDPNAGRTPCDAFDREPTDYVQPLFLTRDAEGEETYAYHPWVEGHESTHIGGTMRPSQSVPDISRYYVEFDETFGGFNFGGGNAQLDVLNFRFDWACG